MKKGIDELRGLRYKLRMMVIPISNPLYIYGNNMSVVHNTSRPESAFRWESNSIYYNTFCESVAMGGSLFGLIPSIENVEDLMTIVLYGHKRKYFIRNILMIFMTTIGNSIKLERTRTVAEA